MVGTQLPLFVGVREHPRLLEASQTLQRREPPPYPTAQSLYSYELFPQPTPGFAISGTVFQQDPHRAPVESAQGAHKISTGLLQGSRRVHIGSP